MQLQGGARPRQRSKRLTELLRLNCRKIRFQLQLFYEACARRRQDAAKVSKVLTRLVDSLERAAVAIEHDPRTQERVARERFGMLRKGEFLYRLVPTENSVSGKR